MLPRILTACFALGCLLLATGADTTPRKQPDEVLIGYFGPDDPAHPQGGDMWRAARLAIEQANAEGGYQGKPFRLVPGWSDNPWGTGVAQVTRMAFAEKVWAIVGGIDGPSTHLAEQVVAKAHLVLINPVSTDNTVNRANVPWMFSLPPGDHLLAPLLAEEIAQQTKKGPLVLVSADDHDSRRFTIELKKALSKHRVVPGFQFEYRGSAAHIDELVTRIVRAKPAAVMLVADAKDTARLVTALRGKEYPGRIFGGPAMGRRPFRQQAAEAAEGVVFPLLYHPRETSSLFVKTCTRRLGHPPDYTVAHTYDAVRLLLDAIKKAGLDRARIRDAVRDISPWTGVTGTVKWDESGSNTRSVGLGTIRGGRLVPVSGNAVKDF